MSNKIRYYHFGRLVSNHKGIITICSTVDDSGLLKMGFSFCKKNTTYIRKFHNKIAYSRMLLEKTCLTTPFTGKSIVDIYNFYETLKTISNNFIPKSFLKFNLTTKCAKVQV